MALWTLAISIGVMIHDPAAAQGERTPGYTEVYVGSELEEYVRFLSTTQPGAYYPWSIRGFSRSEIDAMVPADSTHPWAKRFALSSDTAAGPHVHWVRPHMQSWYNSTFPSGQNDGVVWAGRGLTTAVQAGISAVWGPVSLIVRPVAFWAQNQEFELAPTDQQGVAAYQRQPHGIDLPRRFGEEPYARVNLGETTLRLEAFGAAAGISTASQGWGPGVDHPLVLGGNAGGFAHAFAGTSEPVDIGIGQVHGRLIWGRLDQSEFSPVQSGETRRFVSGAVGVFQPVGLDGLEIGATRFVSSIGSIDEMTVADLLRPLGGVLKAGLANADARIENQIASVFARWALPRSGFEVYGEFVKEDFSVDVRHVILEPDDLGGYLLGLRKVWLRPNSRYLTLRAEVMSTETAHRERGDRLATAEGRVPLYVHTGVRQGHTQRGQLLASPDGFGGAGSVVASDYYHSQGRWTVEWRRSLHDERPEEYDVSHSLGVSGLWFKGRFDLTAGASAVYNLNRFPGDNAFSFGATFGTRFGW